METVQGRKLFKGGNYMRKYGNSCFSSIIRLRYDIRKYKDVRYNTRDLTSILTKYQYTYQVSVY